MIGTFMLRLFRALKNKFKPNYFSGLKANAYKDISFIFQVNNIVEPIIFDVGAHHGESIAEIVDNINSPSIYAFEPFSPSFKILFERYASDPRIRLFNIGFSDNNTSRRLHVNSGSYTNSILMPAPNASRVWGAGHLEYQTSEVVEFTSLDEFCANKNLRQINLLKLDVQGAEHLVLNGGHKMLINQCISLIYAEVIISPTYVDQLRLDRIFSMYMNYGYAIFGIYNLSYGADGRRLRQFDVLFCAPHIKYEW